MSAERVAAPEIEPEAADVVEEPEPVEVGVAEPARPLPKAPKGGSPENITACAGLADTMRRRSAVNPGEGVRRFGRRHLVQCAGRPMDCREALEAWVAKARVLHPTLFRRPGRAPKIVVRHTLRHTGVTLLSEWGVPADDVREHAGMSSEVYDRVYKHLDPDHMSSVMAAA